MMIEIQQKEIIFLIDLILQPVNYVYFMGRYNSINNSIFLRNKIREKKMEFVFVRYVMLRLTRA